LGRDGEKLPGEIALKILKNSVQVFQMRDTSLIVIGVRRDNPDEAADIANELAGTYRDYRLDAGLKDACIIIDAFGKGVQEQFERVEAAEEKVNQLRVDLNVSSNLSTNIDELTMQQLESDRFLVMKEMLEKERLLRGLKELEGKEVQEQASFVTFDQTIINTLRQLQDVAVQLNMSKADSSADQNEVKRYLVQKEALEERLRDQLQALQNGLEEERRIAKDKLERLDVVLAEIRSAILESRSEKYRPFRIAQAELETERFIYNQLKAKHEQEMITLEVPRNPVEIIDVAEPNRRPVSPDLFRNVLASVIVAVVFGLAGTVLLILGLKSRRSAA
jgi:uncharacterized protein involved in exopolysaccharide biosynthesis